MEQSVITKPQIQCHTFLKFPPPKKLAHYFQVIFMQIPVMWAKCKQILSQNITWMNNSPFPSRVVALPLKPHKPGLYWHAILSSSVLESPRALTTASNLFYSPKFQNFPHSYRKQHGQVHYSNNPTPGSTFFMIYLSSACDSKKPLWGQKIIWV